MKATELGRAINIVEQSIGIEGSFGYDFNKIASDRWALVMVCGGKTVTLATGKDIAEALKNYLNGF